MTPDRALVADLIAYEADLADQLVSLTCERDAYRLVARAALTALHQAQLERDVLAGQRLIDRRRSN